MADGAEDWYRKALDWGPDNLFALNNVAVVRTDSDPQQAVALAKRGYAKAQPDAQILETYGAALLAAGDTEQARTLLTEAYGLSGQTPAIGLNPAKALTAAGEPVCACENLGLLLARDFPRQAEARALLRELPAP
jgi:tetratricopeptide (TPR) repeat protein